jgi:hypothetical protein
MGNARLDLRRGGNLSVHSADVADKALRQDERPNPALLLDAEIRTRCQYHGELTVSVYRDCSADAADRRGRLLHKKQRGTILNSGHTKVAANIIRNVEINGEHQPRRFSTWAPKAIATIGSLSDTLEDRAVVVTLQRKPPTAKVERLRRRDSDEFAELRSKAARWAADNVERLKEPDPKTPDSLNDRAADNWRPLLAIADLAGGELPSRARDAAGILSGEGHDASAINVELLGDIRTAFGESECMTSADLVAALVADPERPWATWTRGDKPLTQNGLARMLQPFAIISETVHPIGRSHAKGYKRTRFEDAWTAYLSGQPPLHGQLAIPKRATVQMPMKRAQLAIFKACAKQVRMVWKMPTCPTAMRVCTLARLRKPEVAEKAILPWMERATRVGFRLTMTPS